MNQYIYTVQTSRVGMLANPTEDESRIAKEHLVYLQGLMASGVGIFAGVLTVPDSRHLGLVIYQAEDDEAAKAVLHHDPAVQSRIMRGRWFPYRIALWNGKASQLNPNESHYLYMIQPVRPEMLTEGGTETEDYTIMAHFNYLKQLTEAGQFCVVGRTLTNDYSSFGIGVLKAKSEAEAWAIGEADPAVTGRVMRLEIFSFGIAAIRGASKE